MPHPATTPALVLAAALAWMPGAARAAGSFRTLPVAAFGAEGEIGTIAATGQSEFDAALVAARDLLLEVERKLAEAPPADGLPHAADPLLLDLLERAQSACLWSEGMLAPFGRGPALPTRGPLPAGPESCLRAAVDRGKGLLTLAPEARLDLREFSTGFAIDRAIEGMKEKGLPRGWVRLGAIERAFGEGTKPGSGVWVPPPASARRLDPEFRGFYLNDQALAIATSVDEPPHLDQRTGQGQTASLTVLAVSELAIDAQLVAAAMLLSGSRGGELRLGSIRPDPSVLWLYGTGEGLPLYVEHGWSAVKKR